MKLLQPHSVATDDLILAESKYESCLFGILKLNWVRRCRPPRKSLQDLRTEINVCCWILSVRLLSKGIF
jgi:hypothetical protein